MNALRVLVVSVVFALSACGGSDDERACVLLEDQDVVATLEGVTAVAQAARESEDSELRALGEKLAQNLARSPGLESLAPGLTLDAVQSDLDNLRRACGDLGSRYVRSIANPSSHTPAWPDLSLEPARSSHKMAAWDRPPCALYLEGLSCYG
jgi:hypothetical protein